MMGTKNKMEKLVQGHQNTNLQGWGTTPPEQKNPGSTMPKARGGKITAQEGVNAKKSLLGPVRTCANWGVPPS